MGTDNRLQDIDEFFENLSIEEFDYILEKALNEVSYKVFKDIDKKITKEG